MTVRITARGIVAAGAIAAGIALFAVGWPRLIAGAVVAPYEDTLRAVARGERLSRRTLSEAIESTDVALRWFDYGATSVRRGGFELVRADIAESPAEQRDALAASIAWLRRGLAQSPGMAFPWIQYAQALRASKGVTPEINDVLRMSLRTAPYEHRLIIPRIEVAFRSWQALAPDVREAMKLQIRRAVDTAPRALVVATRRNFALRQVREAVADSPVHRQRFNIVYLSAD